MTIDELYQELISQGSKLCYPFWYDDKNMDFLDYTAYKISLYMDKINELDNISVQSLNHVFDGLPKEYKPSKKFDFIRDVKAVANMTLSVLQDSFRSYHEDAYEKLKHFFVDDNGFYLYMLPQLDVDERSGCFYRIRKDQVDLTKGDGEMFHVPFEKRHLVSSQRYSIPGYPALYLGGDFFTSWCELDKPELIGVSYAAFKFKEHLKFLDLGLPYVKNPNLWEKYSLCAMYPILIACMVRVKYPNAAFKPEYIMPQLMMKLVRDHGKYFQGIVYMSNKLPMRSNLYSMASRNLVVCVYNTLCESGYDKDLANKMMMTNILSFSRKQINSAIYYEKELYSIDFNALIPSRKEYHDINVPMNK